MCTECLWSISAPVFVVGIKPPTQKKQKHWGNHTNLISVRLVIYPRPRYITASFFPSPPHSTPTPVPMTKTLISITVFVIFFLFFFKFLFLLYCSTYIVVLDWFVSYAFMSVGKLCTVTYPPNKPLNLKQLSSLIVTSQGVFHEILICSSVELACAGWSLKLKTCSFRKEEKKSCYPKFV